MGHGVSAVMSVFKSLSRVAKICTVLVSGTLALGPLAGFASEPDPVFTGSLPGGGGVARHGHLSRIPHQAPPGRLIVLGFAGDLGFSGDAQSLSNDGAVRHGRVIPWRELTAGVAHLLKADATFVNLETVITDRPDLAAVDKSFNFAASSTSLKEAIRAGINVLTAANNHAADYGAEGISETLRHLEGARVDGLKAHVGLGSGENRYRSEIFYLQGTSIGLAAVGRGINPAGGEGYGQPLYASTLDFERVNRSLGGTQADVRVLSVHYNDELALLPAAIDQKRIRRAVDSGNATIVFGHHSHVASGLEKRGDGLIFYGLGNFLHAGTQNMARYGQCRDFGLHVRVYLWISPEAKPLIRAVEVTPLKDMHEVTKQFAPQEAAARIELVNAMSEALTEDSGDAVRLLPTGTGSGLSCFPVSELYGDALEARCKALTPQVMNVSAVPRASLAACKAFPAADNVRATAGAQQSPQDVEEQKSKRAKPSAEKVAKKSERKKSQSDRSQKKSHKGFLLFGRAD